jgi:hypothetical protein
VSGTWSGFPGSFLDMSVSVDISVDDASIDDAEYFQQSSLTA